jgi:hypothetical protein
MTVTKTKLNLEEIKRLLNSGIACYHLVQNLLYSHLLLKNLKNRIYKTIILHVVVYCCKTWSLTLREEHRLGVFENRVLRKIVGLKRDEVKRGWRILHNEELCNLRWILERQNGVVWAGLVWLRLGTRGELL